MIKAHPPCQPACLHRHPTDVRHPRTDCVIQPPPPRLLRLLVAVTAERRKYREGSETKGCDGETVREGWPPPAAEVRGQQPRKGFDKILYFDALWVRK